MSTKRPQQNAKYTIKPASIVQRFIAIGVIGVRRVSAVGAVTRNKTIYLVLVYKGASPRWADICLRLRAPPVMVEGVRSSKP